MPSDLIGSWFKKIALQLGNKNKNVIIAKTRYSDTLNYFKRVAIRNVIPTHQEINCLK
jgi:hypothetical protein